MNEHYGVNKCFPICPPIQTIHVFVPQAQDQVPDYASAHGMLWQRLTVGLRMDHDVSQQGR